MAQNRHLSRTLAMQTLYEWEFRGTEELEELLQRNISEFEKDLDRGYVEGAVRGTVEHWDEINAVVQEAAPEWPLDQVARVDKNILRVAVYEMLFEKNKDVPPRVSINEAIEVAKTYGSASSSKFVNGALGYVYRKNEAELAPRDVR